MYLYVCIIYIYMYVYTIYHIIICVCVFGNTFVCPSQLSLPKLPKVNAKTARMWYMKIHLIAKTRGGFDGCAPRGGVQVADVY